MTLTELHSLKQITFRRTAQPFGDNKKLIHVNDTAATSKTSKRPTFDQFVVVGLQRGALLGHIGRLSISFPGLLARALQAVRLKSDGKLRSACPVKGDMFLEYSNKRGLPKNRPII